ncbi:MAG: PAS domain S-box protein [Deltaproteobacteria bacterium]|nr:PAS domain S-box protein [Deltaproteobacteria bacterium]
MSAVAPSALSRYSLIESASSSLQRINLAINTTLDLQEVLHRIVSEIVSLFSAQSASVILYNLQEGQAELTTTYGQHAAPTSLRYPLAGSLAGWVASQQRSLRMSRVTQENWPVSWQLGKQLEEPLANVSVLMTPLWVQGAVDGCLETVWRPPHDITDYEEALLEAVAVQAAIAITNARLYHEKEQALQDAQRQAEALRISEERYRTLTENIYDLLCEIDEEGRFVYLSPNYPEVTGFAPEDLLKHQVFEFVHPDDLPAVLAVFGDPTARVTFRSRYKSGEWRWLESAGKLFFTKEGKPRAVIVSRDISDRKRMEDQLKREAEIATALAHIGQELMGLLDKPLILDRLCRLTTELLGCDCSYTLLWNPQENGYIPVSHYGEQPEKWETLRLVKMPPFFIKGLLALFEKDVVAQINLDQWQHAPVGRLATEHGLATLLCIALRRGAELAGIQVAAVRSSLSSFSEQHWRLARGIAQIASLALVNVDLLEELTRANRLKEDFVGAMSHELRTPLNIILGYNQLLRDENFGPLNAEQQEVLGRIDKNTKELFELINAVLDLSRLQSRRIPLTLNALNIPEFLSDLQIDFHHLQTKPGLRVEWDLAPELPALQTDATKLKMVLKNLLTNALKFTQAGLITISVCSLGTGVEFRVADTGVGIAKEDLPYIFEPFRQGKNSTVQHRSGVGLGLYIVRQLLDLLGGSISVESVEGKGSLFRVWMPQHTESLS